MWSRLTLAVGVAWPHTVQAGSDPPVSACIKAKGIDTECEFVYGTGNESMCKTTMNKIGDRARSYGWYAPVSDDGGCRTELGEALGAAASPGPWRAFTAYDVFPMSCRASDYADRDYGDAEGDAYFALKRIFSPLFCAACQAVPQPAICTDPAHLALTWGGCLAPELDGPQVTRRLELEYRLGTVGNYGSCNLLESDGSPSCAYKCDSLVSGEPVASGVGARSVAADFGSISPLPGAPAWDFYDFNAAAQLGGWWISLGAAGEGTAWRVRNATTISYECHMRSFYGAITRRGAACFQACPSANQTSPCWIRCFFETAFGAGAGVNATLVGGMGRAAIADAWRLGFRREADGGCAPCPPAPLPCPS